ncbi:MAG: TonB-dependent receptor [Bacteroidota bacterium]
MRNFIVTISLLFFLACTEFSGSVFGQKSITGTVSEEETNLPLFGASIYWENTTVGTKSKFDGHFTLTEYGGKPSLIISFIGYEKMIILNDKLPANRNLDIKLRKSIFQSDEIIVSATRATDKSAMAFTNIGKEDLLKQNAGQDLPILLNLTPSLVTTTDAGAGIGYTGLRIRGSDATRINVTVNGIPINDAESQGVYWVNMPDLASSVSSIQIQRGVGTSTNGAGAFGGSVNIQSNEFNKKAYAEINSSVGSFNSFKNNIRLGSGLLANKFTIDGRLSKITSAGFVDRAFSDLKSYYLSGAYYGKKSFVRLITFGGKEKTYQSWNGISEDKLETDRTYNSFTYPNQTDNYTQTHYQLLSTHTLSSNWSLNANLHYTKGKGYYEEFKEGQMLSNYGFTGANSNVETELVRQKWLDNDFYGTTFSLDYNSYKKLSTSMGGGYNIYDGDHFGEIISAKEALLVNGFRWYKSNSVKKDFNIYSKTNLQATETLNIYADLQLRTVSHDMEGTGNKMQTIDQMHNYTFFNPKIGATASLSDNLIAYMSFSVGQKEPNRTDFVDSKSTTSPKAEKLNDLELGLKYTKNKGSFTANAYWMNYKDQLVLTGAINEVGESIRTNIPKSYRLGLELETKYAFSNKLAWAANMTLSQNKVRSFEEFIPDYEGSNLIVNYKKTDIAYSPNLILGSQIIFKPIKAIEFALLTKYVGLQFLDNTSNKARSLDAYITNDLRFLYNVKPKKFPTISIGLYLNNVLNEQYESNGYTFSYLYENQVYTENFYYPQAGRNFMATLSLIF